MKNLVLIFISLMLVSCNLERAVEPSHYVTKRVRDISDSRPSPPESPLASHLEMDLLLNLWAFLDKEVEKLESKLEAATSENEIKTIQQFLTSVREQRHKTWVAIFSDLPEEEKGEK